MGTLKEIIHALLQHDYMVLADPNILWIIYIVLLLLLCWKMGFYPRAFLPGDTLLISLWCINNCQRCFTFLCQPLLC